MRNNVIEKTILTVTLVNIALNFILAIFKIVIGFIGFSQALVADGIHSFSDVVTDTLVYIAARTSRHDPDKEYPYGLQRIETLGTIVIALILVSVAGSIAYEAILRLADHHMAHTPSVWVVIVAIAAIIINEALFHYTKQQGENINSNLLVSNAWHKRSDVFVSLIVLLSVIGSLLGLKWLDAIGALIISALIFRMSVKMIWRAIKELIDHGVDEKKLEEIKNIIRQTPGVHSIHQLRSRLHGSYIFVDLHIIVDPKLTVSEGHHIGEEVHAALFKKVKNLYDVTVHIDPENDEIAHPSLHLPNREQLRELLKQHWSLLPGYEHIQKMNLHYLEGKLSVEIFISHTKMNGVTLEALTAQYRNAIADVDYIKKIDIYYA